MRQATLPDGRDASTDRVSVHYTSALGGGGRLLALVRPQPGGVIQTQRKLDALESAATVFDNALAERLRALRGNEGDAELAQEVAAFANDGRQRLRSQGIELVAQIEADRAAALERRAELLAPPAPETATAVAVEADTRAAWDRLPDQMRGRLRDEMASGKHPALVLALGRHPIPAASPDAAFARGLIERQMVRERADELAHVDRQIVAAEAMLANAIALQDAISM